MTPLDRFVFSLIDYVHEPWMFAAVLLIGLILYLGLQLKTR